MVRDGEKPKPNAKRPKPGPTVARSGTLLKESEALIGLSSGLTISVEELQELYARRYTPFRRGAAAIIGDESAAHDVVQDAFARALTNRRKFRGGSAEAWVWRIVERVAFDYRRSRSRIFEPVDEIGAEVIFDASDDAVVAEGIARLPPRQRLVVFLRYFADLSYAEIARVCGIAEGTVAATLAHAHDELRVLLEPEAVDQ
jgi:RNA polymerase sigma factor (sigma-70 family)